MRDALTLRPARLSYRAPPVRFADDIALSAAGDGVWKGTLSEGWETPRGPLGGYVMAIVMQALELAVDDPERQARSMTMHFLRVPRAGPVTVHATVERAGGSLTRVSGRLEQDGKLLGLALGAYSKPFESPLLDESPMPEVEPPEPPEPAGALPDTPAPDFLKRMVFQHRFGDFPFTRSDQSEVGGWLGLYGEDGPLDAPTIALLADAWFPAPWPRLSELAPAPTVDLTVHFRSPLPIESALVLGRFRTRLVRDGFFEEDGELWAPDGTLVAQSRQLGLLIGAQA
jgi:acyl-CoA thioesterase